MKILDLLTAIPKIFDWYFNMDSLKRIQLNFISIIFAILTYMYYTHNAYADNVTLLNNRIDTVNSSRAKEQEKYTENLKYYTDKFSDLLFKIDRQKEELKQIKEDK